MFNKQTQILIGVLTGVAVWFFIRETEKESGNEREALSDDSSRVSCGRLADEQCTVCEEHHRANSVAEKPTEKPEISETEKAEKKE